MQLRSAAAVGTNKPNVPAPRRGAALLGVFAILLQAALFAWHDHPLPLSSPGAPALQAASPATGPEAPGRAHDDCQICFALGHHSAAPAHFVAATAPAHAALRPTMLGAIAAPGAPYLLFRSRAPPRA